MRRNECEPSAFASRHFKDISVLRPLCEDVLAQDIALFLDLDGTLVPIESEPQAVGPSEVRTRLLRAAVEALDGRLAIVSGRSLKDIDRILEHAVVPVAGVHGLERRNAEGVVNRIPADAQLKRARRAVAEFQAQNPCILIEDKTLGIALHFRAAPWKERQVLAFAKAVAESCGLWTQEGKMVVELRPPGPDKGDALRAFMKEEPFAGAIPIYAGDDATDANGFRAAEELGGYGILVGDRRVTRARRNLASVDDMNAWLAHIAGAAR
jgi:trehalose 6-phosphate phosphatase